MNLRTIALAAALSASPLTTSSLAAQRVYHSAADRHNEAPRTAPLTLDKTLGETSTEREHHPAPRLYHSTHKEHLLHKLYEFKSRTDNNKNTPSREYEVLVHTPPLGKHGLLNHIEANLGIALATHPGIHPDEYRQLPRSPARSTNNLTYSLETRPSIVFNIRLH
jgi:hypothetical protein